MAKVRLQVTDNRTVNVEGKVYRAGDVLELERDSTAEQLLSAGSVVEVKPARRSGTAKRKTSGVTRRGS
jgi:hypothetical protein